MFSLLATGDLDKEIQNYEAWQTKYPRDFQPYNNLGNDYAASIALTASSTVGRVDRVKIDSSARHNFDSVIKMRSSSTRPSTSLPLQRVLNLKQLATVYFASCADKSIASSTNPSA